jgi:hypothetical protein
MNKAKPNILNKAGHDPNNPVFPVLLDRLIDAGSIRQLHGLRKRDHRFGLPPLE